VAEALRNRLAVQLYTVRREMQRDADGTLHAIADMGWPAVQVSGFPYEPRELARTLKALGLATAGIHIGYDRFRDDLDGIAREAEALDTRDVVCPYLPEPLRTADELPRVRDTLWHAQEVLGRRGLYVSYHNHDFEFQTSVGGRNLIAYLLEPGPAVSLTAEFDVYWLAHGGQDPVTFMEPYRGRIRLFHLKDMTADDRRTFAEVGTGTLDFPAILAFGVASGVAWYAVEQDECPGNPLDSLRTSWNNLQPMVERLG
jgi:sugar phosphate isomerase/epimerase